MSSILYHLSNYEVTVNPCRNIITLSLILLTLVGCGTVPTPINEARPVPQQRILSKLNINSSTPSQLTIIRDSGLQGIEHVFEVWINGIFLAELKAGESYSTPIDPGAVFIEIRMFNVLGTVGPVQIETLFSPGKTYVYRVGIDGQAKLHMQRDLNLSS